MSKTTKEHKSSSLKKLNFLIFICSTSRYKQKKKKQKDISGNYIKNSLKKAGHNVISKEIIADDIIVIACRTTDCSMGMI